MPDELQMARELAGLDGDPSYRDEGWYRPRVVEVEGESLRFSDELDESRLVLPRQGLLTAFTRLEEASAAHIAAFARSRGRLYLCEHGLPYTHIAFLPKAHAPDRGPLSRAGRMPIEPSKAAERVPHPWGLNEAADDWRRLARQMGGILKAAILLRDGKVPPLEVWERAGGDPWRSFVERFAPGDPELPSGVLRSLQSILLAEAAPRLFVSRNGVAVGGSGVFTALAIQLALVASGNQVDFLPCSELGCINPAGRPRKGAKPYCEDHLAQGVRNRDVQKRHRERVQASTRPG